MFYRHSLPRRSAALVFVLVGRSAADDRPTFVANAAFALCGLFLLRSSASRFASRCDDFRFAIKDLFAHRQLQRWCRLRELRPGENVKIRQKA
jgi:hypothetical protein